VAHVAGVAAEAVAFRVWTHTVALEAGPAVTAGAVVTGAATGIRSTAHGVVALWLAVRWGARVLFARIAVGTARFTTGKVAAQTLARLAILETVGIADTVAQVAAAVVLTAGFVGAVGLTGALAELAGHALGAAYAVAVLEAAAAVALDALFGVGRAWALAGHTASVVFTARFVSTIWQADFCAGALVAVLAFATTGVFTGHQTDTLVCVADFVFAATGVEAG